MKIGVIGGGSIGLLFAGYIRESFEVTVFTRTKEQAKEINNNGIVIKKNNQKRTSFVAAKVIADWDGTEDLTIVTVKQYQLADVMEKLAEVTVKDLNILFLQNGMGHLKLLARIPEHNNVFVGSIELGALRENSFTVNHNGEGITNLAVYRGDVSHLIRFASKMPASLPAKLNDNYYKMLLQKLIINAVINPLTAALNVPNGMLLKNEFYKKLASALFSEISALLQLAEPERSFQRIVDVCAKTAQNRSSMLKDVEAGRKTEIDAILGFLLEEAQKQGKTVPLLANYYYLVKGKEMEYSAPESVLPAR